MVFKFTHNKPQVVPVPREEPAIGTIPISRKFPFLDIEGIEVAERIPRDERQIAARLFCVLQARLYHVIPPMRDDLPEIDADPVTALAAAFTPAHARCCPAPRRPVAFRDGVDLGRVAVASPYACYLENRDGALRWDVTDLERFERHPGLRAPAATVEFTPDASGRRLTATRIDSELGASTPGDHDWGLAQRLAMCALATHLSLVRHFNWVHLVGGDPIALVTRNHLPVAHPIRRLIHPHVYASQSSDEMVTLVQMSVGGDFERTFSYTHRGMCELYSATADGLDLRMFNPVLDHRLRGLDALELETPALDNRRAIYEVFVAHVTRYLSLYYDDASLAADEAFGQWVDELARRIPRGVREIIGPEITIASAAELLATCVYLGTVEHEIVDSGVWNYQLWPDVQPARVSVDGRRARVDEYQRVVNNNFNFQIPRTPLMSDFSGLALDDRGADAFRRFRADLAALQVELDRTPAPCWRIDPRSLKANMNA
jgi:arachidonate 15-lipoxygenase